MAEAFPTNLARDFFAAFPGMKILEFGALAGAGTERAHDPISR
jgi:hypothetical protein